MLTRLIVNLYAWLIEISLWFVVLISSVAGYHYAIPILNAAGMIPKNRMAWAILGALVCALAAFLLSAVLTGPFLVLVDIRKSVRALEGRDSGNDNRVQSADLRDLREPSL
jgi:hypothetical protein